MPPFVSHFFSGPGFSVLMWPNASNLPAILARSEALAGFRRSKLRESGVAATLTIERGLDPELGLALGLKVAAWGLGRNSLLLGLSRPLWTLATPLERLEKFGSTLFAGPVGGGLSCPLDIFPS